VLRKLGVTTQAIYSRVNNQNRKFLKELEGHGIVIGGVVKEPPVVYNACNNELAETKKLLSLTLERINSLEKENSLLKEGILNISVENGSLDQAIENLKRKIKK